MEIKTKITFKDYWNLYIRNFPTNFLFLVFFFFIPLFLLKTLFDILMDFKINSFSFVLVILLCGMIIFFPFRHYTRIKKAFYSNKKIQENNLYTFNEDNIQIKGESFETEFTWKSIYKVKELKNWFLIYQSINVMNIVPKKNFSKEQIHELRQIILRNDVKAKLRND